MLKFFLLVAENRFTVQRELFAELLFDERIINDQFHAACSTSGT